jgi:hypothetical protein
MEPAADGRVHSGPHAAMAHSGSILIVGGSPSIAPELTGGPG